MATLAFASPTSPPFSSLRRSPSTHGRFPLLHKSLNWGQRSLLLPITCSSTEPNQNADDSEFETASLTPSSSSDLTYKLYAGLRGVGFLETTYLTYLKLTIPMHSASPAAAAAAKSSAAITLSFLDFGLEKVQKEVGLLFCIASLVVVTLNRSYSALPPVPSSPSEINLPYFSTEITTSSSPFALSLAKHLSAIGAKMYGAFWCSHCVEQKQMFGSEAAKLLNYVECFPGGFRNGTIMQRECFDVEIEGFPTWVINGQVLSGEKELTELAQESGFDLKEFSQPP
ncbi:unnamed protein product [Malus baccata var. baccata]